MPDTQFKYFPDNSIDASSLMDYCPSARTVFIDRMCTSTSSIFFPNGNINHMLEIFGDRSRCLMSTLHQPEIVSGNLVYTADVASFASAEPVCYDTECFASGSRYLVKIATLDSSSGTPSGTCVLGICTAAGQTLPSGGAGRTGEVTCAAPAEVCFGRDFSEEQTPSDVFPKCGSATVSSLDGNTIGNELDANGVLSMRL